MSDPMTSQAREIALFRYTSALERGDFETVAAVLAQAESDPILAQMIREVDDVVAHELEQSWQAPGKPSLSARRRTVRNLVGIAAVILMVAFLSVAVLTLTGPAVGNVFSGMVSNLPSDGMPQAAMLPTPNTADLGHRAPGLAPTSSIIEVTPLGGGDDFGKKADLPAAPTGIGGPIPTLLPPGTATPAAAAQSQGSTPTPAGTQGPGEGHAPIEQMIVKNGEIDLLVQNTDAAINQVTQIADDNGGYVLSNQAAFQGDAKFATITLAVRADQFETAMRRLRQIALKVNSELSSGQDVSSEYVDLQSRLKNLEATRDRIAGLLAEAKTVEQAMAINQQLSDVEGQIEQIKGRMTYLSGRAAYSTITVSLTQQVNATPTPTLTATFTPTPTSPWSLSPTINSAARTQVDLARGLLEIVTWLIVVPGPYLLVIALAVWGFRRWTGRDGGKTP
jgi:hypothetical protein